MEEEQGDDVVHLITSGASLLSGRNLNDCQFPDDPTCVGGMAAVAAFGRYYNRNENKIFMVQKFFKSSPFVNMHPLNWVINRLIIQQIFHLQMFISTPSLLNQNIELNSQVSNRDITDLQSSELPMLLSNVAVPPTNSWYNYIEQVHFDTTTGIALISIVDNDVPYTISQIDSTKAAIRYIHVINQRNGCFLTTAATEAPEVQAPTAYQRYIFQTPELNLSGSGSSSSKNNTITQQEEDSNEEQQQCWISVILYSDIEENYWKFLDGITSTDTSSTSSSSSSSFQYPPPQLIINIENYETFDQPQLYNETGIWVSSCGMNPTSYCQHSITKVMNGTTNNGNLIIDDVVLIKDDITGENFNDTMKDNTWDTHIAQLAILAQDAMSNDPVVGETNAIPVVREGSYRACKAGECSIGNLFTDALRWSAKSDIAFTSSGGYRGLGKPAGPTKFTDIYNALPFPNTMCLGSMIGFRLFELLNYTTSVATFQGEDTANGGRLLQVSGLQVTYNTQLQYSRLLSVDVWNETSSLYEPLDRLRVYSFATDSYICGGYHPYPDLTVHNLNLAAGEIPGVVGEILHQNIVADYLTNLGVIPYDTSIQGRLINDTHNTQYLDLIETEDSCHDGYEVWKQELFSCVECPTYKNVMFSDSKFTFDANHDHDSLDAIRHGRVLLLNREPFPIAVKPASVPDYVQLNSATMATTTTTTATTTNAQDEVSIDFIAESTAATNTTSTTRNHSNNNIVLEPGDSLVLKFDVQPSRGMDLSERNQGGGSTDRTIKQGSVAFAIYDGGSFPGCSSKNSLVFDVFLRLAPAEDRNYLGNLRWVGFSLTVLVDLIVLVYVIWIYTRRTTRVVKVMQPTFLFTICFGVFLFSSVMIPLSIDDEIVSEEGCSKACMSIPWLLSMGFTISFAALYAKLLRINKLFNQGQFRRVVVETKDVMAPFVFLFSLNLILLLIWTVVDPLQWERAPIDDQQDWNTVGKCSGGVVTTIMLSLILALNFGSLILACYEAFKARNVSSEFSESKYIGIAIYGWIQIIVVSMPVMFLIDRDDNTTTYFLHVMLVFVLSVTMLLIVSFPVFRNILKDVGKSVRRIHVTGLVRQNTSDGKAQQIRESLEGASQQVPKTTAATAGSSVSINSDPAATTTTTTTATDVNNGGKSQEEEPASDNVQDSTVTSSSPRQRGQVDDPLPQPRLRSSVIDDDDDEGNYNGADKSNNLRKQEEGLIIPKGEVSQVRFAL